MSNDQLMKYQRFFDVSQSPDLPTFERRLIEFANEMDFGIVNAILVVDRPGQESSFVSVGNTPSCYEETCSNVEYSKRDPVTKRLKRMSTPFVYNQDLYVKENCGDKWENQATYGYHTGVAVALHLPGNKHFLLGMDRVEALPKEDSKVMTMLATLQLLAVYAQDVAVRLLGVHGASANVPKISPRELDVLRWTMEGKSAWATGKIMSVSENTINFHLRNILRKMDCSSKHQAVLKAISFGLL